jgi:hypothetical protein
MPAARIGNGVQVQPDGGKNDVGIVTNWDGNFSNNYEGKVNCRKATHIHYGEGECNEYVNQPDMTPDDPTADVDGVREYH